MVAGVGRQRLTTEIAKYQLRLRPGIGHEKPGSALDWEALARFPGTLVFYMGIGKLPLIAERLTAAGRDPAEAAAVIERGTYPNQRTIVDTLGAIAARAEADVRRLDDPQWAAVGSEEDPPRPLGRGTRGRERP